MLSHYLFILTLVKFNESLKMEYSMSVNITVLTITQNVMGAKSVHSVTS